MTMAVTDLEVLETALHWMKSGQVVSLATVVETWGSAPRKAGAQLAIREDGPGLQPGVLLLALLPLHRRLPHVGTGTPVVIMYPGVAMRLLGTPVPCSCGRCG